MRFKKTLILGDRSMKSIVYGYSFPSMPDRVKIGMSRRGLKRIADQATAFPEPPDVIFILHHHRAPEIESEMHDILSKKRADTIGREWFLLTCVQARKEAMAAGVRWGLHGTGKINAIKKTIISMAVIWIGSCALSSVATSMIWVSGGEDIMTVFRALISFEESVPGGFFWWLSPLSDPGRWTKTATIYQSAGAMITAMALWFMTTEPKVMIRGHKRKR